MKLSEICIKKPVLATMMSLALVLFGIVGMTRLPVRELPDIDPPIVNVQTLYPGASAAVVETQVTEPIEDVLTSVEGINNIRSESREQSSSVTVEFDLSRDIEVAAQDVRDRVARVRGRLPDDIEEPIVSKQDADARPSIWVALYSDRHSTLELTDTAENVLKDHLQTVPGVSSILVGGSKRFAIRVWLDPEKMAARGVTVPYVEQALREQSVELPSGRVESWQREMSIETRGQLKTPEEYNNLVIKKDRANFVRMRDIGYAEAGVEDERSVARYNSRPSVGIGVIKQSKANIIEVAHGIRKELESLKPLLPEGIVTQVAYDESVYVEKSVREVWITLGLAFLLVVAVIYVFLQTFRATFVPAVTIPVSIVSAFAVLYAMGFSINIVTMLAFVLSIGMVVDDAILVLENIHRHIEEGMKPFDASVQGMKEIGFAVIATTVALVAVFIPMAFQTTDTGRLFIEFAIAISFSVIISSFVALTLAPMLCSRFLKADVHDKPEFTRTFERWLKRQQDLYARVLAWSLNRKTAIIALTIVVLAGGIFFFTRLEREFLPDEDKGRLFCVIIAPEGATSEYTDRMVQKAEKILSETAEVEGYFAAVALSHAGAGRGSEGLSFIRLKEGRRKHVRDIMGGPDGLRSRFFNEVEGALVIPVIPKAIGVGFSQPFQLVLQGQDLDKLNEFAQAIVGRLQKEGFLMNVRTTFELNKPELRIHINRDRASALGVTVKDISRTLQVLFGGSDLAKFNLGGEEYETIVQLERKARLTPGQLEKLYVKNDRQELIQLSNVVDYEVGGGPSKINHFNRLRSAVVEATPVNIPLSEAAGRAENIVRQDLPSSFHYEWDGEVADMKESGHEALFVILLAIAIIYMVLAAQFESLADPLIIMLTIPLAALGAFGSLWLLARVDGLAAAMGPSGFLPRIPAMGLNLFSQIGLVLLIGLVTKNGILLVEFANQQMSRGKDPLAAMKEAARIRFRPIMMTAFSTVAGTLPIAIGFGAGAESRRPMGVVVVGGLIVSTFLTLFLVPVVYVIFNRFSLRFKKKIPGAAVMLLIVSLGLTGCASLGRDYTRPAVEVPGGWKLGEETGYWKKATPQDRISRTGWWEVFNDENLNSLEKLAIESNHDLESAAASFQKARALAGLQRAALLPEIGLNPQAARYRRTKHSFTSTSAAASSFIAESYSVPFDLYYELDLWGRVRRELEARRAEADAAYDSYHSALLSLTAEVARTYFLIRELDAEIEIIDATIKLRRDANELVAQRLEAGIINELDFDFSRTELAKAKAARIDAMRLRAGLVNALALLCGKPAPGFELEASPLDIRIPRIPVGVPSTLLERRPDIAETERSVQAANARIGAAKAAFFPAITLTGTAGYESVVTSNLFEWESRTWSIGPGVSLPLFTGGRNRANFNAALAEYDGTVARYRQAVLRAFSEVETALHDLVLGAEQAAAQEDVLASARDAAALSSERYKQGLVTFLDVVDAERSRLDAELETTRILSLRLIATVQLVKALGGGWEPAER